MSIITTNSLRRRLGVCGGVTLAVVAGLFALGGPTTTIDLFLIGWLAFGGLALLVVGVRDRLALGVTTVGWPRIAAVGLAVLSVAASSVGFLQLLTAPGGWGILTACLALGTSLILAFGALECGLGGVQLDEELFTVE